jgi:hypothetical protein
MFLLCQNEIKSFVTNILVVEQRISHILRCKEALLVLLVGLWKPNRMSSTEFTLEHLPYLVVATGFSFLRVNKMYNL